MSNKRASRTSVHDFVPRPYIDEMRADSMEECWDRIKKLAVPSVTEMRKELMQAGWVEKSVVEYRSPCGKSYRGPYGAWKAMKGMANG